MTPNARDLIAELEASWQSSCEYSESQDRTSSSRITIEIAGLVLRIEGVGPILDRLRPALGHHRASDATPDLTVKVWDLESAPRRPAIASGWFHSRGDQDFGRPGHEIRVRYDWPQAIVQAWDDEAGVAWWCIERPNDLAWWEEAAPLRPVLAWWLTSRQRYFAHGAALAVDGRATLLVGPGGSGKSTTALRAQRAGFGFLGDDYCLVAHVDAGMGPVQTPDTRYQVASVYRSVKLRPVTGTGDEREITRNDAGRKIVLCLDGSSGGPLVSVADLVNVASVEVGNRPETQLDWVGAGSVLRALAPTTVQQLPGVGERSLAAFATMLRELPTAQVVLGADPDAILDAVRRLIRGQS